MDSPVPSTGSVAHPPRDQAVRRAGLFLLLAAVATVVMVYARVSADADQATLSESLRAIAANRTMYVLSAAARLVSGIALMAAAWYLLRTWIIREGFGTPMVPYLFVVSGALTAMSAACALTLAATAPDDPGASVLRAASASVEAVSSLRWITAKASFTAAGLALLAAALRQWKAGGVIRRIAPASALIGMGMLMIWVDAASILHRITGPAFVVWLVVISAMLLTGRVERHFSAMR